LRLRESANLETFTELSRAQPFESSERQLVENLIRCYVDIKSRAGGLLPELEGTIIARAIAQTIAPAELAQQQLISHAIETFGSWASQTYEGQRVSSGCVVTSSPQVSAPPLSAIALFREDFAKNLSDGVDSWWLIYPGASVSGFETSSDNTNVGDDDGFYPLRYKPIALRCDKTNVGVVLNRNGEILIFARQQLRFAMRRGIWVNFAHESIVKQMGRRGGSISLGRAIYASCLDVSFARSGGCIGLLTTRDTPQFRRDQIVSVDDRIETSKKLKPKAAAQIVAGRVFSDLPRHVRKELLGLDGALVLVPNGRIVAAGAILKLATLNLGNQGGRSAAAKTLSRYGLGIKISADGVISGFKKEFGDAEPCFKVG
jgi:hypothetical protein